MSVHPAILWEPLEGNWLRCNACSLRCRIKDGLPGICKVRENRHGELVSLVYGRAIGVNVDPVEKKPLSHFYPGSRIFSIATVGCNFRCKFCQNWDISQWARTAPRAQVDAEGIVGRDLMPEEVVERAVRTGCKAIAYTYTEPTIFIEYAYDTAKLAHERGLKNVFVSNGYLTPEAIDLVEPVLDAINVDLKGFDDKRHRKVIGAPLEPVLETLRRLAASRVWLEVTTLVIPDHNDSDAELASMAEFLAGLSVDIPWHVSRFHPDYRMMDRPATPARTLMRAYDAGKRAGLRYVYVGNMFGNNTESTYCPGCGAMVIERDGYTLLATHLDGANCAACGTRIAGVGLEEAELAPAWG